MSGLTVGELAQEGGVKRATLRYYERRGLLPNPPRTASGYRVFPQDAVQRIRFIRHAQALGFTLREIKELLALRVDPDTTCAQVKARAEAKVADIVSKLEGLERMKATLEKLSRTCSGRGATSECPILEALDHPDLQGGRGQGRQDVTD